MKRLRVEPYVYKKMKQHESRLQGMEIMHLKREEMMKLDRAS